MSPDFQGLCILESYLASVKEEQLEYEGKNIIEIAKSTVQVSGPRENNMSCRVCNVPSFNTLEEFKQHRQSEEHLNNLTGSLSLSQQSNDHESESFNNNSSKGSPFFEIICNESKLRCYKVLLADRKDQIYSKSSLKLTKEIFDRLYYFKGAHITIALNGGGYFAAAIFDNSTKKLVCSKTFRRYTTRRKQGGSQSLKDNQKSGKIHSAGSLIRRENEKKLQDEISNLFLTWKPTMDMCSITFCNRDSFLMNDVFKDVYTRILPFTTYQADFEEICRCYTELISSIKTID